MGRKTTMTVAQATTLDLATLRRRAPDLAESALAATALALARELDDQTNSATAKANCARALLETMNRLRELAPPGEETDRLDELTKRRAQRRDRSSAP